jgi:hypothetical protein
VIPREKLEARKNELLAQKEQLVANLNAVAGAIQVLDGLLVVPTEDEAEPTEKAE